MQTFNIDELVAYQVKVGLSHRAKLYGQPIGLQLTGIVAQILDVANNNYPMVSYVVAASGVLPYQEVLQLVVDIPAYNPNLADKTSPWSTFPNDKEAVIQAAIQLAFQYQKPVAANGENVMSDMIQLPVCNLAVAIHARAAFDPGFIITVGP